MHLKRRARGLPFLDPGTLTVSLYRGKPQLHSRWSSLYLSGRRRRRRGETSNFKRSRVKTIKTKKNRNRTQETALTHDQTFPTEFARAFFHDSISSRQKALSETGNTRRAAGISADVLPRLFVDVQAPFDVEAFRERTFPLLFFLSFLAACFFFLFLVPGRGAIETEVSAVCRAGLSSFFFFL